MIMRKRASILNQMLIHIILVGLIFAVFFVAVSGRADSRGVKQQILEKEVALLIDSAESGMSFEIRKVYIDGIVSSVRINNGRVFIVVDGLPSTKGYPYFSRYSVSVEEEDSKFVISVR